MEPFLQSARDARGAAYVNHEGGDVGAHSTERSLYRHVANYLAAADLARAAGLVAGPVLDVGSGTGALAAWMADRLRAQLHLVDRDDAVRRIARSAFPTAQVHAEIADAPDAMNLVTGMEVIEHISPAEQEGFVRALLTRLRPGGMLVLSTPDESGYVGGWSGYAPHIGPLTAPALQALLDAAAPAGAQATVWRMEGDAFHLGKVRRVLHPLANRLWTRVEPVVAPVTHRLVGPAAKFADLARTHAGPTMAPKVAIVPAAQGQGTGMLGVVRLPAA